MKPASEVAGHSHVSDVSFADTAAGAEVQANGNVYAVLAGVTAAQITGAAGYLANQGLGL